MTLQTLPAGLWVPRPMEDINAALSLTFLASMTNAAGKVAIILQAPKAGNIHKVVWGVRTVTTGATVDVRLETVNTGVTPAAPSGTLVGTTTNGSQVVAASNTVYTTTLTADATVTQGQNLAVVIANASPGSMQVPTCLIGPASVLGIPYMGSFNGTSWSFTTSTILPMVALEYSDGSYAPIQGVWPTSATLTTNSYSTSTTPDVWGLRFSFPFPVRARGAWVTLNGAANYTIRLVTTAYNQGAGTGILASSPITAASVRGTTQRPYNVTFDSAVTLSANTNYRLIVSPSTTSTIAIYDLTMPIAAQMNAWEGGANFMLTSAKDPTQDSDWTNYNSGTFRQPFMGLLLDGFDDGINPDSAPSGVPFLGIWV